MCLAGKYAYLAREEDGLAIIDISNPSSPVFTGHCDILGRADKVFVSGNYAYARDVDNDCFRIIDISNPAFPKIVGSYPTSSSGYGIRIEGTKAYLADSDFQILDISDPLHPSPDGQCDIPMLASEILISGNYAYVIDYEKLAIVDISNPSSPEVVGTYDGFTGMQSPKSLFVSGNYLYLGVQYGGLFILDISNPSSPVLAGEYFLDNEGIGWSVYVSENYAYVGDYFEGLRMFDVTNPASPALIDGYEANGSLDIIVSGNYAYVAGRDSEGLMILSTGVLPTVETGQLSEITTTSANISADIPDSGMTDVTERGVCWGTSPEPTIAGTHMAGGSGKGDFSISLTGLNPNTTYYARAYATNSGGTAYGKEISFKTKPVLPVVTTAPVTDITSASARGGGSVAYEAGDSVLTRGVCWDTDSPPHASVAPRTEDGTALGDFASHITGLQPETTYHVRAYAQFRSGTATYTVYGNQVTFTTPGETTALPGDADGDGHADLNDAILILKILSGVNIGNTEINPDADADGDGKIGMADAVYILRFVADAGE
ncbi:hypothetical protein DENIS_0599 [Desulfonema ishimotonii]|uniref:Dockerin domain-containing protein n=2 Tax=Desulfonema ishimotonii TaxID=45657 RepID=A0A401FRS1_9BACT|nr:hypothetical protein DENIS_0599 [Desulfonema ishimotonii]